MVGYVFFFGVLFFVFCLVVDGFFWVGWVLLGVACLLVVFFLSVVGVVLGVVVLGGVGGFCVGLLGWGGLWLLLFCVILGGGFLGFVLGALVFCVRVRLGVFWCFLECVGVGLLVGWGFCL